FITFVQYRLFVEFLINDAIPRSQPEDLSFMLLHQVRILDRAADVLCTFLQSDLGNERSGGRGCREGIVPFWKQYKAQCEQVGHARESEPDRGGREFEHPEGLIALLLDDTAH